MTNLISPEEGNKAHIIFKKPQKSHIQEQDILSAMKQDQQAAFARYRELVKARRNREKLHPKEPEVYHLDIFKTNHEKVGITKC